MTLIQSPERRQALIERVKAILLRPKDEWPKIAAEPETVSSLYANYIVYVAAIPVLCTLIGSLVFGYSFGGITFRPSLFGALWSAILQYALQLGAVYVFALIINAVAPRFGGASDDVSALKLAAYSATASWIAGIFTLVPALGFFTILGLYSIYLLYTGAPVVMRVPQERAFGFTASIVAIGLVLGIVVAALMAAFMPSPAPPPGQVGGKVSLPGDVTVDMDRLNEAAKRLETITKNMEQPAQQPGKDGAANDGEAGGPSEDTAAISADALKALLPSELPGGFARVDVSTSTGGAAGFSFANAKAVYKKGDASITLSLADLGAMGAFASLGGLIGANATEENETSYTKMGQVDGRMTIEEFNRETQSGHYGTIVSDRIMVDAEGTNTTMDALKAASALVDLDAVAALAR